MGLGFKGMVIRYACTNGMIFATGFGSFRATHLGTKMEAIKKFSQSIDRLIDDVAVFERKANETLEMIVPPGQIRELIIGSGLAPDTTDEIISQMPILVPSLVQGQVRLIQ